MPETKYRQYAGSPDIFTLEGKYVSEPEARKAGLFTPQGLSPLVEKVATPRPDVKVESDFPRLAGLDIGNGLDARPASRLTKEEAAARAGVDISRIIPGPEGGFMVGPKLAPSSEIISDTSGQKRDITQLGTDIDKALSGVGVVSPFADNLQKTLQNTVDEMIKQMGERRKEIETRRAEDIATIEKRMGAGEEELRLEQEEALARAEGRTRIGGFFTQMEAEDIQRMQRQHRVELATFQAQREQLIQTAKRAYDDQDYQLARDQLTLARDLEKTIYDRNQDYFNNLLKFQALQTPVTRANQAVRNQVFDWMEKYPDAFTDIEDTSEIIDMTIGEARRRVLASKSYLGQQKVEVEKELKADLLSVEEAGRLGVPFGTTRTQAIQKGIIPKFGTAATEEKSKPKFSQTQLNRGAAEANIPYRDFVTLDPDIQNLFISGPIANLKKIIDQALKDFENPSDIEKEISEDPTLPDPVKDALVRYLKSKS